MVSTKRGAATSDALVLFASPAVSHAILVYNRGRSAGLADGIVITPSHNPPEDGGFKYNPPSGGPANREITGWIEARPNSFPKVAIDYLFQHRPQWRKDAAVGKTLVSSQLIDRVTAKLGRRLYEVPVGFKWFVDGLLDGSLGFGGEESAGASFIRLDGSVWITDKDGIVPALLSAEISARMGRDPGEIYRELAREFGESAYDRVDAPATPEQKQVLAQLSPQQILSKDLAGEKIMSILTRAPGSGAAIGGVKVTAESGWFAARSSGTENIYKIYAESFRGADYLRRILAEAQAIVGAALAAPAKQAEIASGPNVQEPP